MGAEVVSELEAATRGDILARVRAAPTVEAARAYLEAAEILGRKDPYRALAVLEALARVRELSREVSARQGLLAYLAPEGNALYQALHGKIQPEVLGRAFQDARADGRPSQFAQALATGLAGQASRQRLTSVVSALASSGLEARKLAAAILAACPPGVADELAEIVLWLALDPAPEVWSHGAVAWGRHASEVPFLGTRLRHALAGDDAGALHEPSTTEARDEGTHVSDAPTVLVPGKGGRRTSGRTRSVLPRRALAALGGLLEAQPDARMPGDARGRTVRAFLVEVLGSDGVDVWDRASAAFSLMAFTDLSPYAELLERRCRREALPVLLNVATVLAERRPAGAQPIAAAALAGLERARSSEELSDWLDAVICLRSVLPSAAAREAWTQVAGSVPGLDRYLSIRDGLAGQPIPDGDRDLGPFLALASAEVLVESRRLAGIRRHVEAAPLDAEAARALEARSAHAARAAESLGHGITDEASLAAAHVEALSELLAAVPPLLAPSASPADRRRLGERLFALTHVLRLPLVVDQRALAGELVDAYQATTPAAALRKLLDWTQVALERGERHPTLYLLRVVADVAASRPELTQLALKRLPALLQAPCAPAAETGRSVQRGLARLVALALDVAELDPSATSASLAAVRAAADALALHPLAAAGLVDQVRERLRSARARAVLDTSAQAVQFSQRRNEILVAVSSASTADPPGTIDGFAIEQLLGRGGFGAVYRCTSDRHGTAAVKVCHDLELARGRDFQRFLDEAVLISRLDHPAIPRLIAIGHHHGYPYIAMEFVAGTTLLDRVTRGDLGDRERWKVMLDLGEVLEYAKTRAVVHRDLKPSNIMLTRDGSLKVLDWGLAHSGRVTPGAPGVMGGTRLYSAPEQFAAGRAGSEHLVDHFAYGRIGMEVLAGRSLMDLVDPRDEGLVPRVERSTLLATGLSAIVVDQLLALAEPDPRKRAPSLDAFLATCRASLGLAGA